MEAEMKMVFQQKVNEKVRRDSCELSDASQEAKLKQSEEELVRARLCTQR